MKHRAGWAVLACAACSGGTTSTALDITVLEEPCAAETQACFTERSAEGLVATSGDPEHSDLSDEAEELFVYTDFLTPSGRFALLEIAVPASRPARVRYHELDRGQVVLRGVVVSAQVDLSRPTSDADPTGGFDLVIADSADPEATRVITGRFADNRPMAPAAAAKPEPATSDRAPRSEDDRKPPPADRAPPPNPPADDDAAEVAEAFAGGCDGGPPPSQSTGGGCDGGSGSGSGCEGDSAAASSCDGCEGDTLLAAQPRDPRRVAASMWRQGWPLILVAWLNRRWSRRSRGWREPRGRRAPPPRR